MGEKLLPVNKQVEDLYNCLLGKPGRHFLLTMSFPHTIYINNISVPTRKGDMVTVEQAKIAAAMAWNGGIQKVLETAGVTGQAYEAYMDHAGKKIPKAAIRLVEEKKERSARVIASRTKGS